ncbi:hypothetical protein [Mesorhizobium sp. M4B.F.Ca.ET.058.02.1.1]|uniref:hypothetical protein n=1 Tax=Mesorhizobium sp. M4B.F.Ca.ET.058.02.1.1 TaxID=2493675 RepID=UPI000F74EB39|nr:hypothetical protein [Mesorhizobium sp. M4B.F.Ca.ET.058.02.1.1]AZO48041.1 hypothetical protein EJ073_09575 [Mesorhizobium sp. M4B.F.Ca.ET.058.02.1.1]TJX39130.1 MAG: hypothetical protein E5W21_27135 [Mesorhizobium sp.]
MQVPLPWSPADRYIVLSPSQRIARDILWVDHQINPRLPILRFFGRVDSLRGYRNMPVLTLDPHLEFRQRDRDELNILFAYSNIRSWKSEDFQHLKDLSGSN